MEGAKIMNMKKIFGACFLGMTLLVTAGCFSSEVQKTGTVDIERIAVESQTGAEMQKKLEEMQTAIKEDLMAQEPKTPEEMMQKQQEFQERVQAGARQIQGEFKAALREASNEVAKEQKLALVLSKDQVISTGHDITDAVIEKLGGKVEKPAEAPTEAEAAKETPKEEQKQQ